MTITGEPILIADFIVGERETLTFSISYDDATTVTVGSVYVWQGQSDVTSTIMPAGSHTTSNNIVTLKPVTAFTGGKTYVVDVLVDADGQDVERFIRLSVARKETGLHRLK